MNQKLQTTFVVAVIMVVFIAIGAVGFIVGERNQPAPQSAPEINVILPDTEKSDIGMRSAFATIPETIIGIKPTSTAISSVNTEDVGTTTPTTTDYFSLGANVEKANINFIVNATSTDQLSFLWSYEVSSFVTSSTTLPNFYTVLNPSSGPGKTYTVASTTNTITLPTGGTYWKITVPLCSNTYDGTDDVPTCHTGLYKFQFGRTGASGIEVYAEVDRE